MRRLELHILRFGEESGLTGRTKVSYGFHPLDVWFDLKLFGL